MKVQIVNKDEEIIDGYYIISINKLETVATLINNACTDIIAVDVLDKLSNKDALDLLNALLQKVRMNGRLILSGIHLLSFANGIVNENIDQDTVAKIIDENHSIIDSRKISNILESHKFVIDSLKIQSYKYEITATRSST
jgi:hypothetical protein